MKNRIKKSLDNINRPTSLRYGLGLVILLAFAFGVVMALEERTALTFSARPPASGDNGLGQPSSTIAALRQESGQATTGPRITAPGVSVRLEPGAAANGGIAPGSIMTLDLCLENIGADDAVNLVAALRSTSKIISLGDPKKYGLLKVDGSSRCLPFTFTLTPGLAADSTVTLTFELRDGPSNLGEISYSFTPGSPQGVELCNENFDSVTPPNLPPGWSTVAIGPGGPIPWQTDDIFFDTPPNSAFAEVTDDGSDIRLNSPPLQITTSTGQLTFANLFSLLPASIHGGVLEISIGGGAFQDILAAGGSFSQGGYTGAISGGVGNPLGGRQAWTGDSGGYIQTVVNLPAAANGQEVIFRWRLGTGSGALHPSGNAPSGFLGFNIDTVSIEDCAECTITCPPDQIVSNTINQCGAVVNYPPPTTGGVCGPVICSPTSGSFFPVGATTVTCSIDNEDPTCTFLVEVNDTQPPTISCPANVTTSTTPGQCSAVVNYPNPTVTDNCPGVDIVSCLPPPPDLSSPAGDNNSCLPPAGSTFPVGTTTVTCCARDTSFNTATCFFTIQVNDTQPPVLTCPPNVVQAAPVGQCSATVTYSLPTVNENCGAAPTPACNPPSGSSFPVGTTTVNCSATDASTNTGTCSFTVTINGSQPLSITCPANISTSTGSALCSARVDYPPPQVTDGCAGSGTASCSPPSGSLFPVGTTTVTCIATSGTETVNCSFTITVSDNQPPSITCPASIVRNVEANQCSAVVEFAAPIASDLCSTVTVSCSPPSGSRFSTGTRSVTCTATDPAGNAASCSFNITVRDTQAPVVTCPPNVTQTAPDGQCSANVNLGTATATDACDGPLTVVGGRSDGLPLTAPFPAGTTTVTYIATDASGNIGRCVQTVTVTASGSAAQAEIMPSTITLKTVKVVGVKKQKKRRARGTFMISNTGCAPLTLTFRPIRRVTDQNRFRETDDSEFFSVFRAAADGNPTGENLTGRQVTINPGQAAKQNFVVQFEPSIPTIANGTSNLDTDEVLPDNFISVLAFEGTDRTLTINARVQPRVKLIDPDDPQGNGSEVTLCRSGDDLIVTYHVFDSNRSDVRGARYEFLDSSNNVVRTIENVDLAGPIGERNLVNGQSFSVEQRFTGANDNQQVVRVRVTISAGNSSSTATSGQLNQNCGGSLLQLRRRLEPTLYLPASKLNQEEP